MNSAYWKDIFETIRKSRRRFIAIMIITILGVTMFSGLQAACEDLRISGDRFFDEQKLHDLQILSTLGLTQEDVDTLKSLEFIENAEGIYAESVTAHINEQNCGLSLQTLSSIGIDTPYVLQGHLPETKEECAVTEKFLKDNQLALGDRIAIEEELDPGDEDTDPEEPSFLVTEYTISGIVVDVTDVNNPNGATSYRSSQLKDPVALILPEAVDSDIYTSVLVTLTGADEMFCFGDDYEKLIETVTGVIEAEIKTQREAARYQQVISDAEEQILEAEEEVKEQLEEAYNELMDGEEELNSQLADAYRKLRDAETQIKDGKLQLKDGIAQLDAYEKQLNAGEKKIKDGQKQLKDAEKQLEDGRKQLEDGKKQLEEQEAAALAQLEEADQLLSSLENAASVLSKRTDSQLDQAKEPLGAAFPQDEWSDAVSTIENKMEPSLSKLMDKVDPSTMDTEALTNALEIITSENPDPEELAALIANASSEDNAEILAQLYASMKDMTADDWQQVGEDVTDSSRSLGALTGAYAQAVIDEEARLQQEIDDIRNADPQPEDAEEQIAALQEQQRKLASSGTNIAGTAVARAFSNAFKQILKDSRSEYDKQKALAEEQLAAAHKQLEASEQKLNDGAAEIEKNRKLLADNLETIEKARKTIADARKTIEEKKKELAAGEKELKDGWKEYYDGKTEGEQKLADGWKEYYDGVSEAEDAFAEARAKLKEIDMATWYVQDRTSLSGYANIKSDADSIQALATVFPILFFIVAILISLTTITRMIEEDRGLIGTYKALGFTNHEIRRKYTIYAAAASAAGSLAGTFFAFIVLPLIVCLIFRFMYLLPGYSYTFLPLRGMLGPVIFIAGILAATMATCRNELQITPAALLRPKAPKGGNRVFLEYITPVWKRMSFLNKVTARNLFRYKKRLFMTIFGIAGCMALLLFGYCVKDSVHALVPKQYEEVFSYDLLAVVQPADNDKLLSYIDGDSDAASDVASYVNLEITTVTLKYQEKSIDLQLFVFPDAASMEGYITLISPKDEVFTFTEDMIVSTINASNVMGYGIGDTVDIQLPDLQQTGIPINAICMNYMSNYIFMTKETYLQYFEDYEPNGILLQFSESCTDETAWAANLKKQEGILSCLATAEMRESITTAFLLINMVVYVIIIMSAALAFVVLFTLSTTNISERERELATIKVLGFYDNEVHLYVDKETIILTLIGVVLGIPLGRALSSTLTIILNLPSIYLPVLIQPVSYFIAAGFSLFFAIIVGLIMDRTLDRIDPVQALKSVE